MNVQPLWNLDQPGLSNDVVHFTGRSGTHQNNDVLPAIHAMTAQDRLEAILRDRRIRAFRPYGCFGQRSVCFSEATEAGLAALVLQGRYAPWGLGFAKTTVFRAGGGPALYVRGSDWADVRDSNLSPRVKAFATRFWPGAQPEAGEDPLPDHLAKPSQWAHEREWRLPLDGEAPEFAFALADVRILVLGSEEWLDALDAVAGAGTLAQLGHVDVKVLPDHEDHVEEAADEEDDPWNPFGLSLEERIALGLPPYD